MLKKIAYHLGFRRWHGLDDIVAPLTRIKNDLEHFSERSRLRATAALEAHAAHQAALATSSAILGNLKRLTAA